MEVVRNRPVLVAGGYGPGDREGDDGRDEDNDN